jgi:hypothetical protein
VQNYQIRVVEDNELPAGTGWVIVRTLGATYLLVTKSRFAEPGGMGTPWLAWVKLVTNEAPGERHLRTAV